MGMNLQFSLPFTLSISPLTNSRSLTNYIVDWYIDQGPEKLFGVIAGITGFLMLLTIPMYIYGKRYRHYWSSHNLLVKLHLDDDPHASQETHF